MGAGESSAGRGSAIATCRAILRACAREIASYVPGDVSERPCAPWTKYLTWPLARVIHHYLGYKVPIIRCVSLPPDSPCFGKRRHRPRSSVAVALTVPAPSRRSEISRRFVCLESACETTRDACLLTALRELAPEVPCGNPINGMVASLTLRALLACRVAALPTDAQHDSSVVFETQQRAIASNLLCSLVRLPLLTSWARKAAKARRRCGQRAVVCDSCGHCLNFGRGKFSKVNFKPTHSCYCRDQREKQLTVCATTGRVYCSYCGSSRVRDVPLVGSGSDEEPFIRVALSNNAALAIGTAQSAFDVMVPCLGQLTCTMCCQRRVTPAKLLYLTASRALLLCSKCTDSGDEY